MDPDGRFVVLTLQISYVTLTLVNIYIPPPFSVEVLSKLSLQLLNRPPGPLLCVGDFNAILDPAMDHLGGGGRSFPSFLDWMLVYNFTKLWCWKHPDERQFSCNSDFFHTMSRIDMAFAPADTLPIVSAVSYLPRGVSDHAPLSVDLAILPGSGPTIWRLNSYWLEDKVVQGTCRKGITEYWKDNLGTVDPSIEWEAFKTT